MNIAATATVLRQPRTHQSLHNASVGVPSAWPRAWRRRQCPYDPTVRPV